MFIALYEFHISKNVKKYSIYANLWDVVLMPVFKHEYSAMQSAFIYTHHSCVKAVKTDENVHLRSLVLVFDARITLRSQSL